MIAKWFTCFFIPFVRSFVSRNRSVGCPSISAGLPLTDPTILGKAQDPNETAVVLALVGNVASWAENHSTDIGPA